jgi:hypothetical protein
MANLTNFAENALIDALLRGQALGAPATFHVALFTSDPTETGAAGTEASYTGYARVAVTSSLANWAGTQGAGTTVASSGTGGASSNNGVITFGAPTGGGPQTVTHWALMSASTGGNMWIYAPLAAPRVLNNGDAAPFFPAASLAITAA